MFWLYVGIILLISFVWALFSSKKELSRPKEIRTVKKELLRSKVLFKK